LLFCSSSSSSSSIVVAAAAAVFCILIANVNVCGRLIEWWWSVYRSAMDVRIMQDKLTIDHAINR